LATADTVSAGTLDVDPVGRRPALIEGDHRFHEITDKVARPLEWRPPLGWYVTFGISSILLGLFVLSIAWEIWEGVGVWGNQIPVGWGWPITNFVFWVGIGHAGTLISAILFLFRQRWRTSINRSAEAMTIFAVMCAVIFPGIHVGRAWLPYWLVPIPNQMGLWPQFRSPLIWDVFAVSIYGTVSLIFWFLGLVPDFATLRDRATDKVRQIVYGLLALGWRGSQRHWIHYEASYLLLAGLATPLVLSVHSVVSFDFSVSQVPGWHTTIFPPYFVTGAIFSGMSMVVTLMVICRVAFKMEQLITMLHFDRMAKLILLTGSIVAYSYAIEWFIAAYSGNAYERYVFLNRAFGSYAWAFWTMMACNVLVPQVFWWKRARSSIPVLFVASILINVGMWFERMVIVVTSLHRDFMPSMWSYFTPTVWDVTTLLGSFGLFFTMFCLFVRFLPMVSISEVKSVLPQAAPHNEDDDGSNDGTDEGSATPAAPSPSPKSYHLLAEFETPGALFRACRKLRGLGFTRYDAHSPFPVHGLDKVMGLSRSNVSLFVLVMGLGGAVLGMGVQWWVSGVAYPLIISAKPFFSWPAFVPVTFECGILGGAFGSILGLFWCSGLPRLHHPLFRSQRFERVTDDRFFVSIEPDDSNLNEETQGLLESWGAKVERVPTA
jgi:Ni/Fe-hydrogenase subunit HybB-like protein